MSTPTPLFTLALALAACAGGPPYALTIQGDGFITNAGQDIHLLVMDRADGTIIAHDITQVNNDGVWEMELVDILEKKHSYRVNYYADFSGNGRCDEPPDDHTWQTTLDDVRGDATIKVSHNSDFASICGTFRSIEQEDAQD